MDDVWKISETKQKLGSKQDVENAANFREYIFEAYGFSRTGRKLIRETSRIIVLDWTNTAGGGGWWGGMGPFYDLVQLFTRQHEAAVHELAHAFWHFYRLARPEARKELAQATVLLAKSDVKEYPQYQEAIWEAIKHIKGIPIFAKVALLNSNSLEDWKKIPVIAREILSSGEPNIVEVCRRALENWKWPALSDLSQFENSSAQDLDSLFLRRGLRYSNFIEWCREYSGIWNGYFSAEAGQADFNNLTDTFDFGPINNLSQSKVQDWEIFASFSSFTMGQFKTGPRALPEFMWEFFEPMFTGELKVKPYYEGGPK